MTLMEDTSGLRAQPPATQSQRAVATRTERSREPRAALQSAEAGSVAPAPAAATGAVPRSWAWSGTVATLLVVAIILIHRDTVASLIGLWSSSSAFGHGFLILPISLFLGWLRREELLAIAPKPSLLALVFTAAAAFAWLIGSIGSAQVVQQLALVAMIQGAVVSVLGLAVARVLWFPLLYLYFGVPFGLALVPMLQDWTAQFVVQMLRLTGIPVYLDGVFLHIPSGSFEVAEACAGVRFLISSLAIGVVFAYVMYRQLWRRVLFVLLAIAVPIVANGFRAYGIVMLAHLSDYKIAAGADHITYGLIFLSLVFLLLLSLGMLLRERSEPDAVGLSNTPPRLQAAARPTVSRWRFALIGVAAGMAAWGVHAYADEIAGRNASAATLTLAPVPASEPWFADRDAGKPWQPAFRSADAQLLEAYRDREGERVDLFIAYYAHQREGAEVVQFHNDLVDTNRWARASGGSGQALVGGTVARVEQLRLIARGRQRVVWYWYWVDGRVTADPYVAKLLEVRAKLLGNEQAAAAIAVSTEYQHEPEEAQRRLARFLRAVDPLSSLRNLARQS